MLKSAYLIVDALDECVTDLPKLLDMIQQTLRFPRIKWIISSRNHPEIADILVPGNQKRSLGLQLDIESAGSIWHLMSVGKSTS